MYICLIMDFFLSTLTTTLICGDERELSSSWGCQQECSPFARLYFIKGGTGFVRHHSRHFTLIPGNLYLMPPHSKLSFGCPDRVDITWVHFTATILSSVSIFEAYDCKYIISTSQRETLGRIRKLIKSMYVETVSAQMEANALLLQLLAPFFNTGNEGGKSGLPSELLRLQPVLDYINSHLAEKITVSQMAKTVNLERAYFSTLFSSILGISPSKYLRRRRIEKAQFLLLNTDDKLETIGTGLGFTDAFHFSKSFKKSIGVSPNEYRTRGQLQP